MQKIEIEVTKLHKIIMERGMTQTDLRKLIIKNNKGYAPTMYILNEIINGKKTNFNLKTLRSIKNALDVSYDDLID